MYSFHLKHFKGFKYDLNLHSSLSFYHYYQIAAISKQDYMPLAIIAFKAATNEGKDGRISEITEWIG